MPNMEADTFVVSSFLSFSSSTFSFSAGSLDAMASLFACISCLPTCKALARCSGVMSIITS